MSESVDESLQTTESRCRGYDIDFWQGLQILHFGFLFQKIITQQYRFQAEKRKFECFWWLAPQKTENGTFQDNWSTTHKFHIDQVINQK